MNSSRWGDRVVPYPDDLVRQYRADGLWGTRTIADELHAVALAHPDRDAVVALDGRLTFRELDQRSDQLAAGLAGLGLVPGDPVLFQVTNRPGRGAGLVRGAQGGPGPGGHAGRAPRPRDRRDQPPGRRGRAPGRGGHRELRPGRVRRRAATRPPHPAPGPGRSAVPVARKPSRRWAPTSIRPRPGPWSRRSSAGSTRTRWRCSSCRAAPPACPRSSRGCTPSTGTTPPPTPGPGAGPRETRVAHLIPIIHNAGIVCAVHAPAQRRRLPAARPRRPGPSRCRCWPGSGPPTCCSATGTSGPSTDPGFPAAAAALTQVVLSGAKVPPALFDDLERRGLWSGQLFGMGEGMFLTTRPGAPRARPGHHRRHARCRRRDEIRSLEPGTDDRGAGRRGRRAVLPRPVHAARLLRRARATTRRVHRRRLLPHRRPRRGARHRRRAATSASKAGSRTSSTAAARRSTPRRSSCCCCATRGSPPPPSSPCRTRGWASAPAPTWWSTASR